MFELVLVLNEYEFAGYIIEVKKKKKELQSHWDATVNDYEIDITTVNS